MKNIIFVLFALFFINTDTQAQEYKSAIGARLGIPLSASFKAFISESSAIEIIVGYRSRSYYSHINVSGAYLHHTPIDAVEGLQWYIGGGASVYIWSYESFFFDDSATDISFGLQGYGGLDYTFPNIPLNLTLDWTPTIFLNGYGTGFGAGYASIGARYVLAR